MSGDHHEEGEGSHPGAGNCWAVSYAWNYNHARRNKDWVGIERKKLMESQAKSHCLQLHLLGGFNLIISTLDRSEKCTLWHPSEITEIYPVF